MESQAQAELIIVLKTVTRAQIQFNFTQIARILRKFSLML